MDSWPSKHRDREKLATHLRDAVKSCMEGKSPWPLFVHGECGSGKTCAALCVLDFVGRGIYLTVEEWVEMCDEARKGRLQFSSGYKRTLSELREAYKNAPMVVLDELGNRKLPDRDYTNLHWAIDVREGKPLVCCSNENLSEIVKIYDDRIASRLRGGTVVFLEGDRRKDQGVLWPSNGK